MEQPTQNSPLSETPVAVFIGRVSGYVANGLRYWEPRRLIYNLVLGLVVVGHSRSTQYWASSSSPSSPTSATASSMLLIYLFSFLACTSHGPKVE
jgi:hypothetical protein